MPVYEVKKRLVSVGRDYKVTDENGTLQFQVDGKVGFARKFLIRNSEGNKLLSVREKLLSISPMFVIKRGEEVIAIVRRESLSDVLPAKFEIEMNSAIVMKGQGGFLTDGIEIRRNDGFAGKVWLKPRTAVHEIYHVSVPSHEDQPLILAIAMSIVEMAPFRGDRE